MSAKRVRDFFLLPLLLAVLPSSPARSQPTVVLDCSGPATLGEALELADTRFEELVIQFFGTCQEDLTIDRSRLTLEGFDATAEVVGGIVVERAVDVTLRGFTVRDGTDRGVIVRDGAAAVLEDMVLRNHASHGLVVTGGASARLVDVTSQDNGGDGIGVWGNSALVLDGTTTASGNGRVGVLVSTGSGIQNDGPGDDIVANDNALSGVWLQVGGFAQVGDVTANNTVWGIGLLGGAALFAGAIEATGSDLGAWLVDSSLLYSESGDKTFSNNASWGILAESGSRLRLQAPTTATGNGLYGLQLRSTSADISDLTARDNPGGTDVLLEFGSRVTFVAGNDVGVLVCDDTVLSEGDPTCPATALPALPDVGRRGLEELARVRALLPLSLDGPSPVPFGSPR